MTLSKNVLANYVGQVYVAGLNLAIVPVYVRYLGVEAFGLVGFYAVLQAWFFALDLGLSPTMSRETALHAAGKLTRLEVREILRKLEWIFGSLGICGAALLMIFSGAVSEKWLKIDHLPIAEARNAIALMGAIAALRWMGSVYRGAITGLEHLVWLNGFNVGIATVRFAGVVPVLNFVAPTPLVFFSFQLFVAALELGMLIWRAYRSLHVHAPQRASLIGAPLRRILRFSLPLALCSVSWTLVTQLDKLLLTSLLPLAAYGHFTLGVMAAGGVSLATTSITGALIPRLTSVCASNDQAALFSLYCRASQAVAIISFPTAATLAFFAQPTLLVWTGDADLADYAAPILALYAVGNGILSLGGLPYYLQFAKGNIRFHLIGNVLFITFLLPGIVWATKAYGAIGAGGVWLVGNLLYFMTWIPLVHRRFAPGLHQMWLGGVIPIVVASILSGGAVYLILGSAGSRLEGLSKVTASAAITLCAAAGSSPWARVYIGRRFRSLRFTAG